MKYISIGAVMTEGTEHILDVCRGSRSYHLTGELASVWLNGRFGFAAVKKPTEEQALLLLLRMGLAIQTDGSGFEEYRALTQCTLVPADRKHPYWGLTGMERAVLQWLREAGLVLSMAELTILSIRKYPCKQICWAMPIRRIWWNRSTPEIPLTMAFWRVRWSVPMQESR